MYDTHNHRVGERIVGLSQPWLQPIVRGKAKAAVEFGAKLDISVVNGWTRPEVCSFDAHHEGKGLADMLERYRERNGRYPARVLAGKIYHNRNSLAYCKGRGIQLSGPALGRPKKDALPDKKQNYIDEYERVEADKAEFGSLTHFLYTEFYRGLIADKAPRRWHNCGTYFLLTAGYNTSYCNKRAPGETERTCRKVGAQKKKRRSASPPLLRRRNTARRTSA